MTVTVCKVDSVVTRISTGSVDPFQTSTVVYYYLLLACRGSNCVTPGCADIDVLICKKYKYKKSSRMSGCTTLIVNFDINKTILMRDMGVSPENMVNSLLSECSWGLLNMDPSVKVDASTQWSDQWVELGCLSSASVAQNPQQMPPEIVKLSDLDIESSVVSKYPKVASLLEQERETGVPSNDLVICTFDDFLERYTCWPKAYRKALKRNFCVHVTPIPTLSLDGVTESIASVAQKELAEYESSKLNARNANTESMTKSDFTCPGVLVASSWYSLLEKLSVPGELLQKVAEEKVGDDVDLHMIFQEPLAPREDGKEQKYYCLVPALFKLIDELSHSSCDSKVNGQLRFDFRVCFRTFGPDIPEIVYEYNLYCSGNHPIFKPSRGVTFDGRSEGYPDRRIDLLKYTARIERGDDKESELSLCLPQVQSIPNMYLQEDRGGGGSEEVLLEKVTGSAKIGLRMVLQHWFGVTVDASVNGSIDSGPLTYAAALQDDYPFWSKHREACQAGKIFAVDLNTNSNGTDDVVQLFFDDNIERTDMHILDVRNFPQFEALGGAFNEKGIWSYLYSASQGRNYCASDTLLEQVKERFDLDATEFNNVGILRNIVKVMPYSIITEEDYYVNIVKQHLHCVRPDLHALL